jgi:coproporphyrinogen III oxidase
VRKKVREFMLGLQARITDEVTRLNGAGFREDKWDREGGGGGVTRVYAEGGKLLEKGGVNFSEVFGKFSPEFAKSLPRGEGLDFYATGVSLVLHPVNPHAPTVHMNYRYLERGKAGWFGGGSDLTPCYVNEEDARHFHRCHADALKPYGKYAEFKKNCDEYFFLPHRQEMRGVGGIFFDYQGDDPDQTFEMVKACADAFLKAYPPIAEKRMKESFTPAQKEFQEIRRGRYVEFNLLYDRGTTFGLKTGGRIESILMSLPLKARWVYDHQPQPGSEEAKLAAYLKPRNWI